MSERDDRSESDEGQGGVNPLNAAPQLAKALKAVGDSDDEAARERAREKVRKIDTHHARLVMLKNLPMRGGR
jgi:hypothetical protein